MKRVLIVDDQIEEFQNIIGALELAGISMDSVQLIWAPLIMTAHAILSVKGYPIDYVYVDVNGTALTDFNAEINRLSHPDITTMSNVLIPMSASHPFIAKDKVPEELIKKLK